MSTVAALLRQHSDLNRRAMRLRQIIAQPAPPADDVFEKQRTEFSALLLAHLAIEDAELYPRLRADPNERMIEIVNGFANDLLDLQSEWLGYTARWTANAIERDWPEFCRASEALLDRLALRILRENRLLYPLIDQNMELAA